MSRHFRICRPSKQKGDYVKILGLGGSIHDFSCCVLENDRFKAIEEERLSRIKNHYMPRNKKLDSIPYCLEGIRDSKDLIITHDIFPQTYLSANGIEDIISINHHLAHAASSYFTSSFSEAAILVMDGEGSNYKGSREWCTLYYAQDNMIWQIKKYVGHCSLPKLYDFFTRLCGFSFLQEGKLMGLAPYGSDRYIHLIDKLISGSVENLVVDMNSFDHKNVYRDVYNNPKKSMFQIMADLAYAVQYVFEQYTYKIMQYLYDLTKCFNLCCAGGAFLNSVMNGKIKKNVPFKNISIFPAPGDSGLSIGSVLYARHVLYKESKRIKWNSCCWGKLYSEEKILHSILCCGDSLKYELLTWDRLCQKVAELLASGNIVGWFQDGAEFGPRALGHRSILADARDINMKDILNQKVKFRENFRPFAPITIAEKADLYFETDDYNNSYMQFVVNAKSLARKLIPAAVHVDGSSRLQTLTKNQNERLYYLIAAYENITGIPVILNTSFNIKGEPIVETPIDALNAFLQSDLDYLVLGNYLIWK